MPVLFTRHRIVYTMKTATMERASEEKSNLHRKAGMGWILQYWKKVAGGVVAVLFVVVSVLALLSDVDVTLPDEDIRAIEALAVEDVCGETLDDFRDQYECVRALQSSLHEKFPSLKCTGKGGGHQPADFVRREYGCCYDRSIFLEEALAHYGLRTRHVALYDLKTLYPFGLLEPGIPSHAISDVRTSRGWMLVGSNARVTGKGPDGEVYSTAELVELPESRRRRILEHPDGISDYSARFHQNDVLLYGIYSRHGKFFEPHLPFPDLDLSQLKYNFWFD